MRRLLTDPLLARNRMIRAIQALIETGAGWTLRRNPFQAETRSLRLANSLVPGRMTRFSMGRNQHQIRILLIGTRPQ